jgi:hypothetical protein
MSAMSDARVILKLKTHNDYTAGICDRDPYPVKARVDSASFNATTHAPIKPQAALMSVDLFGRNVLKRSD